MNSQAPLPLWIARLPADSRRRFAWVALVGIVLILPGVITFLFVLLQSNDCSETQNGRMPFSCTSFGIAAIRIAMAAIIFPPVLKFLQLFQRILKYSQKSTEDKDEVIRPRISETAFEAVSQGVGMGQVLLSGNIERFGRNSHTVIVNGERVQFLSIFPFQKGQLKPGDFVHLVYQKIFHLENAKTVLAYSDNTARNAFGASAWIYSAWVPLLAFCIIIFESLKPSYGSAMVGIIGALLVLDLAFLSLMFRARSRLRTYLTKLP